MSEQQAFRDAMSRLGAAVNIVTTDGPAGLAGFTASAVCSVTDSPPTLLVCLNRNASVWPVFQANGQLCVNTLAAGHEALSGLFGGKTPMEARFAAARLATRRDGLSAARRRGGVIRLPRRTGGAGFDPRCAAVPRAGHRTHRRYARSGLV